MTTIKFRRDTSANWTSVNPIPSQGEPCYETDTGKLKIGNGSDNYVTLPYVSGGGSAPTNMVTTDTDQTISGSKTFTKGITTTDIYPSGIINFSGTSGAINSCKQIAGGYGAGSYIDLSDMMDISGRNSLTLKGGTGGLKLTAASSASITCENDLIAPNIRTTANGTIKLAHPMNNASGLITLSNDYGQLSISSSLEGNNNLLGVVRGTAYALINGDNITTRDKDGNESIYINSKNIDTTYMKWDSTSKKLKVDTAAVAQLAMPSDKYVDLTLGASGTTYTAPAGGWVFFQDTGNQPYSALVLRTNFIRVSLTLGSSGNPTMSEIMPVKKNDIFYAEYSSTTGENRLFRFIYAEGAVPTNT